jgi:hypothetical protein
MMRRYPLCPAVLSGVLAALTVPPAYAQSASCSSLSIEAGPAVNSRWPDLLSDVRDALDARDDLDRCARIQLTLRDTAIAVEVRLPDGRAAERTVARREDIVPTLESLLLVPPRTLELEREQLETERLEPTPPATPPAKQAPAPVNAAATSFPIARLDRAAAVADRGPLAAGPRAGSQLRIDLSILSGARVGDGQSAMGLGVFSFVELSGWLIGVGGRADRYRSLTDPNSDSGALELALLGGRRFRSQSLALDLLGGLAAVLQGTDTFEKQTATSDFKATSSSTVPRLLLATRLNFNARSTLHPFVGLDGELGPTRANDGGAVPYVSRLPVWTVGLALGATVGTQ